jgi:Domain of unknown function (DUF4251)
MKTSTLNIGRIALMMGFLMISFYGNSQDVNLSRKEKKVAKKDREFFNFQSLDTLLKSKNFILTADYLDNQHGTRTPVLSDINFIKVDSTDAVLQTGSMTNLGMNGVGGATAEGSIRGFKMVKNLKNLSFSIRFTIVTDIGIYDVSMMIYSDRNARATITGLTRGELTYEGRIKPTYGSHIYKGHNSI